MAGTAPIAGIMGMGAGIIAGWYPGICIIPGYADGTGPSQVGPYLGPRTTSLHTQAKNTGPGCWLEL